MRSRSFQAPLVLSLFAMAISGACATSAREVRTSHFVMTQPSDWVVKQRATRDGEPTIVVLPDQGETVMSPGGRSEVSPLVDVEVRLYTWDADKMSAEASNDAVALVADDLKLGRHSEVLDACGTYQAVSGGDLRSTLRVFGQDKPTKNLRFGKSRLIVVGGNSRGTLLAAVARIAEDDRNARDACVSVKVMRSALQTVLDRLTAI